ncbi:MAG: hypothetical protein L6R42_008562 [Xanthoria sp. 1 TBL-2021]|nr:MAG: hypothetical protein L6R42_008562 [Xanthoria sp. 1 TBL-2021]
MDGVSIAASIIGIGAAGSQIAIKLYTLATQISTASDRISSISNDVFSTSAVLQQLGELMTTTSMHDGTTIFSQGGLDTTRTSAAMCETIFKDIEHAAREASEQLRGRSRFTGGKIKLSRSERLKWPFLQPSIDTLRNDLREAKSTLMLMLHITLLAFSKKMAEIHQTTSKNIVEQREIIDAILVYQKQQHSSQRVEAQAQPLSSSSFGGDNLKAVISNTDGETSSRADENSTLAQCRSSDPATLLPLRLNNVLMAMPPPKTLITKTTSMKSASSRIGQSITADGDACDPQSNYEDHTVSASGQSSLRGGGVITPTESTVGKDAEGIHNLTFFLMKPIIKDLGEVIQLSWKVHNLQMQQTKIRNQVIENEKDGLPLVHEVCQGLYAHEHAALEGLISRASAGSNVSLQSLKRIYIDMKHRDILFKGVPGLEFVLERTVQQPVPQTSLSMEAQAAASAPLQPSGSAYGKKVRLEEFLNDTNIGSWADEMDDVQPAAPTRSPVKDNKPEVNELKDEKRSRSTAAARKFRERREAQHEARTAELDIWKQRAADNGWREEGHASQGNQRRMASDTVELSGSEVASVWANKMDHTLIDASSEKPPEHRKTPLSGSSATRKIDIDRYKRARNAISAPLQDLNWKTASEPQLDPRETQDTELQSKDHGALLSVGTLRRKPVKMGISWQAGLAYKTSSQALEDEPGSQDHLAGFSGLEGLETNERPGVRQP